MDERRRQCEDTNLSFERQCHQRGGYNNSVNKGYLSCAGIPSKVLVAVCVQFCGDGGLATDETHGAEGGG